ncbi:uncharacterized protein EDB91DRAFT_1242928 [Suillus paluster]|uniref:uncharacterized protein n=1 Tax=Suillus paluster TaxID=48578 RepID=UPI001B883A33|nr:uncharacterized protein EDB91DRAFT_1242928 [Suillus paluster]KAG1753970.1 hypothetical protein EDB91DRAFT_1242928 [Suillus paluster]
MARGATLNPTSMPFFPGSSMRNYEEDGTTGFGFGVPTLREQDGASVSSQSASSADRRSLKSSPSPSRLQEPTGAPEFLPDARFQLPPHGDRPPYLHQVEPERQHLLRAREMSKVGSLESLPEADDTPNPITHDEGMHTPGDSSPFVTTLVQQSRNRNATPPVNILNTTLRSASFNFNGPFPSSSPVSSLDSGSQLASGADFHHNLEAQLKASPLIRDLIDRLQRCEYNTLEIQRDISDIHRKVNILIERTLSSATSFNSAQPEFKDPFAPASNMSTPAINIPRASFSANIAPNQSPPADDITQISQRLNTLTTSVGQLLALQTQQHIQNATTGLPAQMGRSTPQMQDMAPNQAFPHGMGSNPAALGHGLPNRPDLRPSPRAPNPPMRTWSAGTLDLPMRADPLGNVGRLEPPRDKRRSVTGSMMRRESVGMIDAQGNELSGSSGRDNGSMVSKWEQLNLAPDLLRSLSKFGVGPPNKIQQRALPFLLRGADIIAQAPPTQERIAAYVIPAIQVAVINTAGRPPTRGPLVIMISTTVDQATQAQRMIRDLGGPIGIRSALGVGTSTAPSDLSQELRLLQQNMPHIICGTPQKLHALFTASGGLIGSEVRFLVLDEVDQLIARNLHEFVFNIVKLLPPPRSRPIGNVTPNSTSAGAPQLSFNSFDPNSHSGLPSSNTGRRFSAIPPSPPNDLATGSPNIIERQTALFSNTVPQDVLNLATAIQLKEPVRVLVRRDGNVTSTESAQGSRGLRQFYLYLAFTAGGRSDTTNPAASGGGHGIIGSGRGASSAESAQAREWKLDALADIFDDVEVSQAIVHVGGMTSLDSVVHKLASRGLEAVPLHGDMNAGTKLAALNKFKSSASVMMREPVTKVLVVNDVQVKTPEVSHVPLIINYDLPKAVEEYAHRVAPAIASNYARAGVVVNFVTATGGDVEMLRSIECFYKYAL